MSAVESAYKREYKLRDIAKAGLKAALRVLPEGYKRFTQMLRQHAAYSWRDPDGRLHLIVVDPKSRCEKCEKSPGQATIVSFWADELGSMLDDPVLTIRRFRLDPELTTQAVKRLDAHGMLPEEWRHEAATR